MRYWQDNCYQLRYTGGLVCDVTQLLVKGHGETILSYANVSDWLSSHQAAFPPPMSGIFVSPTSPGYRPRLRALYEAIPMAFLIEKAGGASSDGEQSVLEFTVRCAAPHSLHLGIPITAVWFLLTTSSTNCRLVSNKALS